MCLQWLASVAMVGRFSTMCARVLKSASAAADDCIPAGCAGVRLCHVCPYAVLTLMRSRLTSRRSRSATSSTACTHISAIWRFKRPTLQQQQQRVCDQQQNVRLSARF